MLRWLLIVLAVIVCVLSIMGDVGCSPWRAGPIWTEGAIGGFRQDRVIWTNQWNQAQWFVCPADSDLRENDVKWIPWESELPVKEK